MMEGLWYSANAPHQFEDSIDCTLKQVREYTKDKTNIKWIVLVFQNALQCACVFYLDGNDTSQTAALSNDSAKKWFKFFGNENAKAPRSFLAAPKELFARCREQNKRELSQFSESVERLINLRNNFSHFYPNTLSVELSGFIKILLDTIQAIETIAKMPRMYRHRFPPERLNQVIEQIGQIRHVLEELET